MRVFFSAGEASGDASGAALARELRNLLPAGADIRFQAVGGKLLREAGAEIVVDSTGWGAIGLVQSIRVGPRVVPGIMRARAALASGEPGVFIPIDFGLVNCRLARHAKRHGWKVLYYFPPGSWRRDRQGADLPSFCDEIVTPFFWSAETLRRMGANAHCFGHPIKQMVKERERELLDAGQEDRVTIAVLPGSRRSEIEMHLPIIAKALQGQSRVAEFSVAPTFSPEAMRERWLSLAPERTEDRFTPNDAAGVLFRARTGIVCSGTATLEAALCVCPHVVIYVVSKLAEFEAKLLGFKVDFIAQPNILLGKEAVPELIQGKATPENLREKLGVLLQESEERRQQIWAFMELDALLGPPDAITKTAEVALRMLNGERAEEAVPEVEPAEAGRQS